MAKDLIWGIEPYPTMFKDKQNEELYKIVIEEELLEVLKSFKKDKCPGPDGWAIELFLYFFDVMPREKSKFLVYYGK